MTGQCMCGRVRFEITEPLTAWGYCHCTRCQRRTGTAASPQAPIHASALRFLEGEDAVRPYRPPDGFEKLFCSTCGSALFSRDPDDPETMSVRLGVLDGDPGVPPTWRQHLASAAPWEPVPDDGVRRFQAHRTAAA